MPDRYSDPDAQEMPDVEWAAHMRHLAKASCGLCNDDGYRGVLVCDHIDHAAETVHGRQLVRDELARIRQSRGQRANAHSDSGLSSKPQTNERPIRNNIHLIPRKGDETRD